MCYTSLHLQLHKLEVTIELLLVYLTSLNYKLKLIEVQCCPYDPMT